VVSETYLTKTTFSATLECVTKLYYQRNRDMWAVRQFTRWCRRWKLVT
jgi:hypothetical protein